MSNNEFTTVPISENDQKELKSIRYEAIKTYLKNAFKSQSNDLLESIARIFIAILILICGTIICCGVIFVVFGFISGFFELIILLFGPFPDDKCEIPKIISDIFNFYFNNRIGLQCWIFLVNAPFFLLNNGKDNIIINGYSIICYVLINADVQKLVGSPFLVMIPNILFVSYITFLQIKENFKEAKIEIARIETQLKSKRTNNTLVEEEMNQV